ncbi:hypothetical protein BGY98DRAFT_216949 [Russula aff. rugulosa BPL654]|nr:hypothetical protein BGY98DRAFT_216949 [Russula aff. rugulosa BPL654]
MIRTRCVTCPLQVYRSLFNDAEKLPHSFRLVTWVYSLNPRGSPRSLLRFILSPSRRSEHFAMPTYKNESAFVFSAIQRTQLRPRRNHVYHGFFRLISSYVLPGLIFWEPDVTLSVERCCNAGNFTLLAVFKMDNGTREPLVLGSNGPDDGPNPSSLAWLGSAASINSIIAKYFVLTDGEITAYGSNGSLVGVSNHVANNSGQLSFFHPDNGATANPAKPYCELFNTSPHGVEFPFTLAVNGVMATTSPCVKAPRATNSSSYTMLRGQTPHIQGTNRRPA